LYHIGSRLQRENAMSAEIDTRMTSTGNQADRLHTDLMLAYLGTAKVADSH